MWKNHKQRKSVERWKDNLSRRVQESESEVTQSCPTLWDPMDCSLPSSSVHGIFRAIVLEWIAISFSMGSFQPRDRTWVFRIVDRRFTVWATREVRRVQDVTNFALRGMCCTWDRQLRIERTQDLLYKGP